MTPPPSAPSPTAECFGGPLDGKRFPISSNELVCPLSYATTPNLGMDAPIPTSVAEEFLGLPRGSLPLRDDEKVRCARYRLDGLRWRYVGETLL